MKLKSTTIRPNAPCPCGSGKKFKNCCRNRKTQISLKEKYKNQYDIILKTPEQVEGIPGVRQVASLHHGRGGKDDSPRA